MPCNVMPQTMKCDAVKSVVCDADLIFCHLCVSSFSVTETFPRDDPRKQFDCL